MAPGTNFMRSKVYRVAHSGDETSVRICSSPNDECHVWREHAFGTTGKNGDGVFGDDGFPDGLRQCAGEVIDAAVA